MSRAVSTSRLVRPTVALGAAILLVLIAAPAGAQTTPAAAHTPSDDTPSIRLGTTIFADYTFQRQPQIMDSDGNNVNSNAFNISRAYITLTGNVSHIVGFRVTADVTRETGTLSSLNGSLTYRLKYAFAQINLDDWMWKGSWTRLGVQQTPYVEYIEQIYRYRFQGTIFAEREGYLTSSDAGATFRTAFPGSYGDLHVGVYNGDGYSKAEANDQKALQLRGSVRPLPMSGLLRGLRVTLFYDGDNYLKNGEKKRAVVDVTFEHKYLNAGFDYLDAKDHTSVTMTSVHGQGWSVWATPKAPMTNGASWEALLRLDGLQRDTAVDGRKKRTIAGVAYWFPHQGSVTAALLLDFEQVTFRNALPVQPRQQRIAVHGLIGF